MCVLLVILAKVVAEVAGWVCVHSTSLLSVLASLCDGTLDGEKLSQNINVAAIGGRSSGNGASFREISLAFVKARKSYIM